MKKSIISDKRWCDAQKAERSHHEHNSIEKDFSLYQTTYSKYFKYLELSNDLNGKSVIEVGPGRFPALLYCFGYDKSYVIEPLIFNGLDEFYKDKNFDVIHSAFEDCNLPRVDETWLLNVMQHVKNPDVFIEKAMKCSKIIRFFEPINYPISLQHPFTYSEEDYRNYFGDVVQIYKPVKDFHDSFCAYGSYIV